MREAEWVERLWQQLGQLSQRMVAKEDLQRLEERLATCASQEAVERVSGKLDTLLINAATKVEVGRLESRLEHLPAHDLILKLETRLADTLPALLTKQEWSLLEARLERTLTKEEFVHLISPLREFVDALGQQVSEATGQLAGLRMLLWIALALNGLTLFLVLLLLLSR
jgi:hypothetical protein